MVPGRVLRRLYQAKVETKADALWLDSSIRILPDLVLFGGASPMSWTKDAGEHSFGLTIAVAGQLYFETAGSGVLVEPGAAIVGRPTDRLETDGDTRFLCVRLSPRLIAPLVPDYADIQLKELAADPQPLRLLISYLRMLDLEETIETDEARHLAAVHVHDLAALAIGTTRDAAAFAAGRGARAARLAAIKQDILAQLAEPELSVGKVAARQALSPRYIHKLFETQGTTFSEFVVAQRLDRARRMLADPRCTNLSISTIAMAVGFGDLSYFNRTFRRRFGATPSDIRAASSPH